MPIALCANKIDKQKRVIAEDEGRQFAVSRGLMYFEISASSGSNVVDMFEQLFSAVLKRTGINGG
jgi:DnaJ family protein C protein 27